MLVAADFHGNSNSEMYLAKFLQQGCDAVLLIGDLTNFGPPDVAESLLNRVKEFGVPMLAIPGNCDPKPVLQMLEKQGVSLHERCQSIENVSFVGLGGSNVTPFKTPFELTEVEIQEDLAAITCNGNPAKHWVLATHAPPFGTKLDEIEEGTHVGSKSIRQYIEAKHPTVLACGHVHEARGIDRLGDTLMVNPGPISQGFAALIKIGNKRDPEVELLSLAPPKAG